jgi:Leucine-rich repeat (LRR) protein
MFGCVSLFDENVIPDTKLRYEIGMTLHEDGNAKITADDMLELIILDAEYHQFWDALADHKPISNLAGLEYAENLRVLLLPSNTISDVSPLEGLKNLRELNLSDNNIVDINPLEGLKNLQRLYLNDNDIVDVSPLEGLYNLKKLDLRNNPLSDDSTNLIIPIIEANGTEVLYGWSQD